MKNMEGGRMKQRIVRASSNGKAQYALSAADLEYLSQLNQLYNVGMRRLLCAYGRSTT